MRENLLKSVHEGVGESCEASSLGEHIGRDKMCGKLEKYWWPAIKTDTEETVSNCLKCQKAAPRYYKSFF